MYKIISKWNKKRKYGVYNGKTFIFGFKSIKEAKHFLNTLMRLQAYK